MPGSRVPKRLRFFALYILILGAAMLLAGGTILIENRNDALVDDSLLTLPVRLPLMYDFEFRQEMAWALIGVGVALAVAGAAALIVARAKNRANRSSESTPGTV